MTPAETRSRYLIEVDALSDSDLDTLAAVHRESLKEAFLNTLGHRFIWLLFKHVQCSRFGILFTARDIASGQVVGHVAVATHVRALALEFLRLHWGAALRCAGRRLLSAGTLSRAFATLSYTLRPKLPRLPQAEILTLSVSERHARLGLLGLIYESLVAQVQSRGVTALRIVTAVRLGRLHGFLERRGWQHRYTMTLHPGEASRVYVLESLGAS